ncbi:MAG: protein kinase [Phycisphaerales bacterium]|nr:protein kinase [Planctomycetota bacterium]
MSERGSFVPREGNEVSLLVRAKAVFLSARGLGLVERQEAVDAACGEDAALKEMVWTLLRGDDEPLAIEALADDIRAASNQNTSDGSRIGHYRLLERIGEGGFGVVYAAEQERPVRRRVALKIIKLGMDTKQVVARFEAERQALALMDHPSIARVYDGGVTPTGRPYFVMELVKGLPITEYCERENVGIEERLRLVVRVCSALRHAHQKGVIHRDIKPSNVLIVREDGKPEPKIIDFGVAKAVSGKLTDRTLYTEVRQIIGTPEYMSPEQADPTVQDVDTRADVYGVGVLLYELLTGTTPFESVRLRTAAYGEMQRIIREEDPPAPSTRVKTASGGGRFVRPGAESRSTLGSTLRGELDWIVMKAIEKDRTRRYASVAELAADIERFLEGEAILAAPPSRMYLTRKFVRRHRAAVGASAVLLAALVIALVGTIVGLARSNAQRQIAEEERAKANLSATKARAAEALASRRAYSASMMSASAAVEGMQMATASGLLDSIPAAERGWEWRVLDAMRDTSVRTIKTPIEYSTDKENFRLGLLLHPDGKSFFTFDELAAVCARQFDLAAGRLIREFEAPRTGARLQWTRVTLAPGGENLFALTRPMPTAAHEPIRIRRWAPDGTSTEDSLVPDIDAAVPDAVLSLDGSALYFSTGPEIARMDLRTRAITARAAPGVLVTPIASPSADFFATGETGGGWFGLRDAHSLELRVLATGHGSVMDVAFSPDGEAIASAADDDAARIWEVGNSRMASGSKGQISKGPKGQIGGEGAEGQRGRGAKGEEEAKKEVAERESVPYKVLAHPGRVGGVVFSHDSKLVATVCVDSRVRIWERETGRLRSVFAGAGLVNKPLMFTADDSMIAALQKDGTVCFWDLRAEDARVLRGHANIVSGARFIKRGAGAAAMIVSGGWDQNYGSPGIVRVWDAATGEAVGVFDGKPGDICRALAVSRDGRRAAFGMAEVGTRAIPEGRVMMVDLLLGRVIWEQRFQTPPSFCCFGADDRTLLVRTDIVASRSSSKLVVCDAATGSIRNTSVLDDSVGWAAAMSPDRGLIAVLPREARNGSIVLIRSETLERVADIPFDGGTALAFSPDGKRLVAADLQGVLHAFDLGTKQEVGRMSGHGVVVMAIAYSPDGKRIASSGLDRVIRLWDAGTFDAVGTLGGHTGHIGDLDWDEFVTADGKKEMRLLSCSGDGTVRIWEPVALRERLEAKEKRRGTLEKAKRALEKLKADGADVLEGLKTIEDLEVRGLAEEIILGEGLRHPETTTSTAPGDRAR